MAAMPPHTAAATPHLGLGLDVGGTQTRWALATADGTVVGQGVLPGFTAAHVTGAGGAGGAADTAVVALLAALNDAVVDALQAAPGPAGLHHVCAGVTGTDAASSATLQRLLAAALHLPPARTTLASDIEMACRAAFAPGGGYLVYAGTGSIAGFVDAQGAFHRAGGRGHLLDDGGSGHWIATRALRLVWRAEDARPGAWRDAPLARRVLAAIGGPGGAEAGADWPTCRRWLAQASRGDVGRLALAVADGGQPPDAAARALLADAGRELALLAQALAARFGPRPVALAGRVFLLSPLIEQALRASLPAGTDLRPMAADLAAAAAARAAAMP